MELKSVHSNDATDSLNVINRKFAHEQINVSFDLSEPKMKKAKKIVQNRLSNQKFHMEKM